MMNIWKSLLGKEQQGEEARENMPALIVCAGLGGLHDRQGFSSPGHYSIKEELEFDDWPQHCHYSRSQETFPSSVFNNPRGKLGSNWSLTPHAASSIPVLHYHDHFLAHRLFLLPWCNKQQQANMGLDDGCFPLIFVWKVRKTGFYGVG